MLELKNARVWGVWSVIDSEILYTSPSRRSCKDFIRLYSLPVKPGGC